MSLLVFDPWGCGECGYIQEIQNIWIEQHQLSRALLWLGRRLMGEWVMDYLCAVAFAKEQLRGCGVFLAGVRDSGVAALFASLLAGKSSVSGVTLFDAPATLLRKSGQIHRPEYSAIECVAPDFFTMALCIPHILEWGDLDHAASLAPCPVEWVRPREMNGDPVAEG